MTDKEIIETNSVAVDPHAVPDQALASKQYVLTLGIDTAHYTRTQEFVLTSKDGGGIRGYSSLLILEELMKKIAQLEWEDTAKGTTEDITNRSLPLPCHYFDYIFGTSTGGYY